jgi:hypothetical protein
MLNAAFVLLTLAAAIGALLALRHLREGGASPAASGAARPRVRGLGLAHGGLGGTGLLFLLAALRGGAVHPAAGVAGFGQAAAWLLGVALLLGLSVLAMGRGGRGRTSILIAVHATLAISGIVVLMALVVLG